MVQWILNKEDGWHYSQDNVRRWKNINGRVCEQMVPQGNTLTQQQFIKDCDVNEILARILKTGQMPANFGTTGVYGDFSEIQDYQESLHTIMKADQLFMELPVHIRQKFENNPQNLINYLADPTKVEESVELGLRQRTDTPDPVVEQLKELNTKITPPQKKAKKSESLED